MATKYRGCWEKTVAQGCLTCLQEGFLFQSKHGLLSAGEVDKEKQL